MYSASNDFHKAVREGKPQKALLIFDDAVFTNEDIDIEQGIELMDVFNQEDDLSIGQALSNQLRFTIFNDHKLLNEYSFGKFTATIGVQIDKSYYKQYSKVMVSSANNQYAGSNTSPYLTRNGTSLSCTFPVKSILIYNSTVYAFGSIDNYAVYDDATGLTKSASVNSFMQHKGAQWEGKGFYYNSSNRKLITYLGGTREEYEFVPLGVFTAVRPNVADRISIDFTCYDQMQLFENDMPENLVAYPCTVQALFSALCGHANVPYQSETFINSTAVIDSEPESLKKATMRKAIAWISEIACSNARFDRDGVLRLEWVKTTNQSFDETQYVSFNPYWYTVPSVSKLYGRDTAQTLEVTTGSGDNGYLIQDNPFIVLSEEEDEEEETDTEGGDA